MKLVQIFWFLLEKSHAALKNEFFKTQIVLKKRT